MTAHAASRSSIVSSLALLALACLSRAGTAQIWNDVTASAVRTIYRNRVPHTDARGTLRTTYVPGTSVVIRGLHGVTFDPKVPLARPAPGQEPGTATSYQTIVRGGFNVGILDAAANVLEQVVETPGLHLIPYFPYEPDGARRFQPVAGDLNGDGHDGFGLQANGVLYFDANTDGVVDRQITWGNPGDRWALGDWNGDGYDDVAVSRVTRNAGGFDVLQLFFGRIADGRVVQVYSREVGNPGDVLLAGRWRPDRADSFGLYRPSTREFFLYESLTSPTPFAQKDLGDSGDKPLAGDWRALGYDGVGLFREGTQQFFLYDNLWSTPRAVSFGNHGDEPFAARALGLRSHGIGTYRRDVNIPDLTSPPIAEPYREIRSFHLDADLDGVQDVQEDLENPVFKKLSSNPAISGWLLADEPLRMAWMAQTAQNPIPNAVDNALVNLRARAAFYRNKTPRPVLSIEVPPLSGASATVKAAWPAFVTATDLGFHDDYPVQNGAPLRNISELADIVERQTSLLGENKPCWFSAQACFNPGTSSSFTFPRPEELNAMIYAAVIHGATGIVDFLWDSRLGRETSIGIRPIVPTSYGGGLGATPTQIRDAEALWRLLTERYVPGVSGYGINQQLALLEPYILTPTATASFNGQLQVAVRGVGGAAPGEVRVLLKGDPDSWVALVVNVADQPTDVRFTFANLSSIAGPVVSWFEPNRPAIAPNGSSFEDRLGGLETRAYRIPKR